MPAHRTVAVLGPIPRDRIITHRGDFFEKYGCALYTVAALSALMEPEDRICPIVHVRREDEEPIKAMLGAMPNVDLTGIRSTSDRGDIVELTYTDQNARIERQTGFMSPIMPADVEFALDADAFVCVPITDYEVGQATLAYIKSNSDGFVLLDGHGPTSTLTHGGERRHRLWAERDAWLPEVDILKMNLEEAGCSWFPREVRTVSGVGDPRTGMGDPMSEAEMPRFAEYCLRNGVRAVCITLDEEGCVAYFLDEVGDVQEHLVPRIPVEHVVDTTGCGDSFAAGMAFGYLETGDVVRACQYGNAMGAQRCSGAGLEIYLPRQETEAQLAATYGSMALQDS
ncbi:MAG: adenosine kinase [Frankiaceae bacterium]|nr:adenosine kinase [Frankiaceae bacterium]